MCKMEKEKLRVLVEKKSVFWLWLRWSLLTPEGHSLHPVIGKLLYYTVLKRQK